MNKSKLIAAIAEKGGLTQAKSGVERLLRYTFQPMSGSARHLTGRFTLKMVFHFIAAAN
jgi:nucleoid DNA-binding protein